MMDELESVAYQYGEMMKADEEHWKNMKTGREDYLSNPIHVESSYLPRKLEPVCAKCEKPLPKIWEYQPRLCMDCYDAEFHAKRTLRPIAVEDLYRTLAEMVEEFESLKKAFESSAEENPIWRHAKLKLVQYAPKDGE